MGFAWGFVLLVLVLLGPASGDFARAPLAVPAAPASTQAPDAASKHPPEGSELLARRGLIVPVDGVRRSELRDSFDAGRGKGRRHQAIDIMAARGTPVRAADEGRVAKISSNRGGGLSAYLIDPSGRLVYYYAHLDRYADGLHEGQAVRRGDLIGYVGTSGNAPETTPHLHFAVLLLAQQRRWWGGEAINPYAALAGTENIASSGTDERPAVRAARPTR